MERNKEKIRVVIDTNILISALIKDTNFTVKLLKSEFLDLQLNCPVWSNDKHFKQQNIAEVYTTEKISELLKNTSLFNDKQGENIAEC
jgi:predicted nucleic acid-binding protein